MKSKNGYMGKVLFVDLSTRQFSEEKISEDIYRKFIGGYGLGVRVLYEKIRPGIDPLGPDNILGFTTGPLTGTGAMSSAKVTIVGKSPLTGTWGDSTVGDGFGPELKRTEYDAVFFTGKSDKPVYCFLSGENKEIRDASHIWGKDIYEAVDLIRGETEKDARVACIGRSGEKLSLISCIIVNKFRAAGRSGLGALMGSKNLKAFAVRGTRDVNVADRVELERLNELTKREVEKRPSWFANLLSKIFTPLLPFLARRKISFSVSPAMFAQMLTKYGTCSATASSAAMQDSPIKNWKGTQKDFAMRSKASKISDENVIKYEKEKYGCPGCPIHCGGIIEVKTGKYALKDPSRKPEYETLASFGTFLLNDNLESIFYASNICDRYGLDTISAGSAIAFAIECYEAGLIDKATTGVELRWGDSDGILALLRLIAEREGFGDIELINAVTGWDTTMEELLKTGKRIQMLRHCFNLREGFKPSDFRLPARVIGEPPLTYGPLKNVKIGAEAMAKSCLKEMGLDELTGKACPEKIKELGLEDLVQLN